MARAPIYGGVYSLFCLLFYIHTGFDSRDAESKVQATCQGFIMLGVMCAWTVLFGVGQIKASTKA